MAKGRIKRLQLASSWQGQSFKADALEVCALCEREIPHRLKDAHHATPEALRAHPEVARFMQWVQDKPIDFNPPTRRSRSKGHL
jgi:hypothetical protein